MFRYSSTTLILISFRSNYLQMDYRVQVPEIIKMNRETDTKGSAGIYHYNARVSSKRPASDYTARALAKITGVSVPLESTLITWQH